MKFSLILLLSLHLLTEVTLSATASYPSALIIIPESTVTLPCLPASAPRLDDEKISWTFTPPGSSNISLLPADHLTLDLDKDGWQLKLRDVGKKTAGTYECVVKGWQQEKYVKLINSYYITVEDAPKIQELEVAEGAAGSSVRLPCIIQVSPSDSPSETHSTPPIVWYRVTQEGKKQQLSPVRRGGVGEGNNRLYWSSPTHSQGDWSVKIDDVTIQDSGVYQCDQVQEGSLDSPTWSYKTELTVTEPVIKLPHCHDYQTPWECVDGSGRSGKAILEESLSEFSFNVYSYLSQAERTMNLVFSPISIASVLIHLLLGAGGETQRHLENALCLPHSVSCIHEEMKTLIDELKGSVEITSNIYLSPELRLNELFINQSKLFYSAVPERLTNSSEENVKMINDWVAEKTRQRIKQLVDSVQPDTMLILLNAVYFNGKWKVMFEDVNMKRPFVTLTGKAVKTPVLYSSKYKLAQLYNKDLQAQVAAFPLSGSTRLFILLPRGSSAEQLKELEMRMDLDRVKKMVQAMDTAPYEMAEVTLPKIKLDIKTNLMDLLEHLGLSDLFNKPNLCGLTSMETDPPIVLTDGQHRSFLSLTEHGVEAGAVTSLSFSRSFASFSALRPFVLLVWSDQINGPLFMGRVTQP